MSLIPADPNVLHPIAGRPRVALLKPLVTSPLMEVGEFSYYDDADDPTAHIATIMLGGYDLVVLDPLDP